MATKAQIAAELYKAIQFLDGDAALLATVGSYGDTLDDDDVLTLLRQWNADRRKRFTVIDGGKA
jgi:hypothetical protein